MSAVRVLGLALRPSRPLPWSLPEAREGAPEVALAWGERPPSEPPSDPPWFQGEETRIWRREGTYRFGWCDGAEFVVREDGGAVEAAWPGTLSDEDAAVYLLGPVLGFVLRLRGVVCFHAAVVRTRRRGLAIVGGPRAGKSTACAALALRGAAVLSDDVAAVVEDEGRFLAAPAWPHVRLWPASVQALLGSADAIPPLVAGSAWDKRRFDVAACEQPAALDALVFLAARGDGPPHAVPLAPGEAFSRLVANAYPRARLPEHLLERELDVLTRLAAHLPACDVRPHRDIARLPLLCRLLEEAP